MKVVRVFALLMVVLLTIKFCSCKKETKTDVPQQQLNLSIKYVDMDGNSTYTNVVEVSHP
jgi:hypothetical protein